ncbi:type 4a pilus biogenesis protein PilO [Cryptosporangium sp. NPDC051539]|uniref:type 4a pilus biogenesis protein PilO n=1 Tax=Cryptosporangium sp. NPDC051539 TaxID=3363962 RepID=UPI0037994E7E
MAFSAMSARVPSALPDLAGLRGNTIRLWLAGGVVGAVLLLGVGWFLLIRPQTAQTAELRAQTETAQVNADSLRSRLAQVKAQNDDLASYRSKYDTAREALPTTAATSQFLRDVQSSGTRAGISVDGLVVGSPTQVKGAGTTVYALPISVTAVGTASKLEGFVNQLQRVQPRAVLINTANVAPNESSESLRGSVLLTLGLQAFVSPSAAGSALAATD